MTTKRLIKLNKQIQRRNLKIVKSFLQLMLQSYNNRIIKSYNNRIIKDQMR